MTSARRNVQKGYAKMVESPIGGLKLVASKDSLAGILWEKDHPRRVQLNIIAKDANQPILLEAERQLKEYFSGRRKAFDLKLDFAGTEFQKKVWQALLTVRGNTLVWTDRETNWQP